jgi:ABC-type sugar transport system ATPase subunit
MTQAARLDLRGVHKAFGDVMAVNGVDLAIAPGEFVSLLGPSGCGKSTLLSIITGLVGQDSGDIRVDGRVVNDIPAQKRGLGLVFQDYAVFSRLTVKENLAFGLKARATPRVERERRIAAMARQLDLEPLLSRRGASLNMSEMQRVAIARALVVEPELLLLDEPMSNLDASVRMALRTELKRIQADLGQTVLYVTHDQAEALAMSDRIAVMDAGRIVQIGSPEEIYRRPSTRFVAEFIGDPPMNMVACEVIRNGGSISVRTALHGPFTTGGYEIREGNLALGIRPHDVRLCEAGSPGAASTTVLDMENLGSEHIAYVGYGEDVLATVVHPGAVAPGDRVWIVLDAAMLQLIVADDVVLQPFSRESQHA